MSMIFQNFTPWQLLLWVAAFFMIATPLLVILATAIINGYYSAKERHMKNVMGYITKVIGAGAEALTKEIEKRAKEKNEEKAE